MTIQNIQSLLIGYKRSTKLANNQIVVSFTNGEVFESYNQPIVIKLNNITYLTDKWDYSKNTGKYRNRYLNETKKEIEKKIKDGLYLVISNK